MFIYAIQQYLNSYKPDISFRSTDISIEYCQLKPIYASFVIS